MDALLGMLKVKRGERPAVLLQLQQMELDGMLVRTKKGKLRLSEEAVGRPAVLLSLSSGFAFVRLEDTAEDCFVPGKALRGALPGIAYWSMWMRGTNAAQWTDPENPRGRRSSLYR